MTVHKRYWVNMQIRWHWVNMRGQVIELLLKFGADPSGQHNGRQHLLEAILQNRMWVAQLLLRSGASARGVRLSKHLKLGMLNCTDLLNHLPCFTWWGQDLPVEQLLKIRHSDLEAQLLGSGGVAAVRLQTQIQVLEALQMLVPLLFEDERLEVLASCACLLRNLQCHPEATYLSAKQPASLIQFQDFGAVQELEEATNCVTSVAFSDKWLASGSKDSKVRIYDMEDFCLVKELEDATDEVYSVAFSDKWLASGSNDKKVRIYNLEDFSLVKELGDATDTVFSVAFSDKWLASGSADEKVRIYNLEDFSLVKELEDATDFVTSVAFSDKWLASGSADEKVRIYNLEDFCLVKELEDATDSVWSVAIYDKWLASGSDDKKVRIYNLEDFSLVKELGDATDSVWSVAISDKWLASGSRDKKVRIYNLEDFSLVKELGEATDIVWSVAFSDKWLASGSSDNKVRIYDVPPDTHSGKELELLRACFVQPIAMSNQSVQSNDSAESLLGILAAVVRSRSNHHEADKFLQKFAIELAEAAHWVRSLALSDKWLASGSYDMKVRILQPGGLQPC